MQNSAHRCDVNASICFNVLHNPHPEQYAVNLRIFWLFYSYLRKKLYKLWNNRFLKVCVCDSARAVGAYVHVRNSEQTVVILPMEQLYFPDQQG